MHEMQPIVIDVCGVGLSASLSFPRGHSVQSLPNHFGLLLDCFFEKVDRFSSALATFK